MHLRLIKYLASPENRGHLREKVWVVVNLEIIFQVRIRPGLGWVQYFG